MTFILLAWLVALAPQPVHDPSMNARGNQAMGFDQSRATHHFILTADGGEIRIAANDAGDGKTVEEIRAHVRDIEKLFASGDFAKPEYIHGELPPGAGAMPRLKDAIRYAYQEAPLGASLLIRSTDASAVQAVQEYLRYQIREHKTGDPLAPGGARPQDATDAAPLVTPAWLRQQLATPRLVLLHVGEKAEYDAAHIPGARHVSHSTDLAVSDPSGSGLRLEMLPPDVLRERLAALGISDDSHVVVYYGKDWVTPATRVVFTLHYAGLKHVSLLDGGLPAWTRAGLPVTSEPPPQRIGTLAPLQIRPLVVDADFVRKAEAGQPE